MDRGIIQRKCIEYGVDVPNLTVAISQYTVNAYIDQNLKAQLDKLFAAYCVFQMEREGFHAAISRTMTGAQLKAHNAEILSIKKQFLTL